MSGRTATKEEISFWKAYGHPRGDSKVLTCSMERLREVRQQHSDMLEALQEASDLMSLYEKILRWEDAQKINKILERMNKAIARALGNEEKDNG